MKVIKEYQLTTKIKSIECIQYNILCREYNYQETGKKERRRSHVNYS